MEDALRARVGPMISRAKAGQLEAAIAKWGRNGRPETLEQRAHIAASSVMEREAEN